MNDLSQHEIIDGQNADLTPDVTQISASKLLLSYGVLKK